MAHPTREEELLIIRSIYCDAYNTFDTIDDTRFIFRSVPIVLSLTLPLTYPDPSHLPELSLDSDGLGVSKLQLFELQMRLDSILHSKPEEPVLFELTEETREFTESLRNDITTCFDEEDEGVDSDMYVDFNEPDRRISDLAIVQGHMGSTTLADIMNRLPSTTKLLHAEVVLRSDLRGKYQAMRRKIQQTATRRLSDRRKQDAAWDELGKEEIVFHGTPRHNVGSIVRSGFIVPGEKTVEGTKVEVRCGSTWGRGIYTSPDPYFSLSYTDYSAGGVEGHRRLLPGQKLIVCAVLMGRRRFMTESYRRRATLEEGYDSHVSPSKSEYIVFNSAQVLPLYVLHLGESRDASGLDPLPLTATSKTSFEGNLTDYARKHLPNGFGAASGHRFMVLEIAPIDDDEELWGDYQHTNDHEEGEFQNERWNYWTGYSIG